MASGHDEARLLDYCPDKLRLFHKLAVRRLRRERADYDLRLMRTVRLAVAAVIDKGAANTYSRIERMLLDQILGEESNRPAAVRSNLTQRLIRMGATYGRKSHK